jgi:hypothetical protein
MYFTNAGEPLREENWRAIDPNNPYDTVDIHDVNDPSIITGRVVVKMEPNSYKNGTWTYYDPMSGTIAKTEEWTMDKPKVKEEVVTVKTGEEDELTPIDVANGGKTTAKKDDKKLTGNKPQAILDYEKQNSGKNNRTRNKEGRVAICHRQILNPIDFETSLLRRVHGQNFNL